jgi:hypothetical protein
MKYGIRSVALDGGISYPRELVERADYVGDPTVAPVHWSRAHDWVRAGRPHQTGLWWDGERMRYAESDPTA